MRPILERVLEFLGRTWKWFALGLVGVLAILLVRRKPTIVVGPVPNPEREDAERHARELEADALRVKTTEVIRAEADHQKVLEELQETQEKRVVEIKDDGAKINDFLKGVGRSLREP